MTIGALIDLGVDFDYLRTEISRLGLDDFDAQTGLGLSRVHRSGVSASKFSVHLDDPPAGDLPHGGHAHTVHAHEHAAGHHEHSHPPAPAPTGGDRSGVPGAAGHFHRKASEIITMISSSTLDSRVRSRAVAIFEKLAISEGRVHDLPPDDVEFHEVGAIDSIVDVVGAAIGIEALGVEEFACSPINVGGGFIHCQHGVYPAPAPATANLLLGATVYSKHVEKELVTPTGAAILAATVGRFERFGGEAGMRIDRVGYGAGSMDFPHFPNCLRLVIGDTLGGDTLGGDTSGGESLGGGTLGISTSLGDALAKSSDGAPGTVAGVAGRTGPTGAGVDQIVMIEANIDDMTAEQLAYASERLMASGALDVTLVPVIMKKGRPGHVIQVMAPPSEEARVSAIVFAETTTIGLRSRRMSRAVLDRESTSVIVRGDPVRVKVARFGNEAVHASPEFDDCARIASRTGRPLREIQQEALDKYRNRESQERN